MRINTSLIRLCRLIGLINLDDLDDWFYAHPEEYAACLEYVRTNYLPGECYPL